MTELSNSRIIKKMKKKIFQLWSHLENGCDIVFYTLRDLDARYFKSMVIIITCRAAFQVSFHELKQRTHINPAYWSSFIMSILKLDKWDQIYSYIST